MAGACRGRLGQRVRGERVVGVRGQVEKADIETEGFKNGMRSQKGPLSLSILSAWAITRVAMNCGVEKVDDGMNSGRSGRPPPHLTDQEEILS